MGKKNLPGIEFSCNGLQPPLSYSDEWFDLIYALSVFTHIPLAWQRAWLDELRRVLRPGGYLFCTVLGEYCINCMLSHEDRTKLETEGQLTLDAENGRASYSTRVLGSWDVFQSPDEVRRVFGKNLELLCYERAAADVVSQDCLSSANHRHDLRRRLSPNGPNHKPLNRVPFHFPKPLLNRLSSLT